ncbi:hypothetical protein OJ252_2157 [Cryptosporidium canis]|uniref:Uncharacterized protein n=1 Tax=Cryptosporidium canis TaxID=195482 RepID=A0ABQ8P6B5_9CRYT|nr:hypothetical protein OJ252_2157 [Cryptosporidium canis]
MKLSGRISACLLLIYTCLVSFSSSEWAGGEPNMGSHIMILPGRPYHGIKMSTIIMVHKKYFVNGRYRLECFSAGPKRANNYFQDPQGEFKVVPLVSEEKSSVSQSILDTLSSRLLPGSLVFVNSELYDSEHRRFKSFSQGGEDFVAFEVTAKLKNVSYSRQIESRDILLNIELEFFKFGFPKLLFQVIGSVLLSVALTAVVYLACARWRLVDRFSKFIFDDKSYKID